MTCPHLVFFKSELRRHSCHLVKKVSTLRILWVTRNLTNKNLYEYIWVKATCILGFLFHLNYFSSFKSELRRHRVEAQSRKHLVNSK